jgi:hypothetical protein
MSGMKIADAAEPRGYVDWELIDDATGEITKRGRGYIHRTWYGRLYDCLFGRWKPLRLGTPNGIVNNGREQMATALTGGSVTYPTFVGVGTGTTAVTASDTALETVSQYDGANDAKAVSSRSLLGRFTARIIAQFLTTEANITITELGLFEANDASTNMWARVRVNIVKANTERLNIYWYIVFERRPGLAIKTGASTQATGVVTQNEISTITFGSNVTVLRVHNNTGQIVYLKLNAALNHATAPTNYDYKLADGESMELLNEEIDVSTISVTTPAASFTIESSNVMVAQGW